MIKKTWLSFAGLNYIALIYLHRDQITQIGRGSTNKKVQDQMGLDATKPVFRVSDKASFKTVSSATETSSKTEISPVASLHMILSKKRVIKALIRLRGCAGWSAPVLFANPPRQVVSRRGPNEPRHVISNNVAF